MFALGLVSSLTKAAGPSKEELSSQAERTQQIKDDRDAVARTNDEKRKQLDMEAGGDGSTKENKDSNANVGFFGSWAAYS